MGDSDTKPRGCSPCSELSRRDEGDGRSIADSQCSAGSYKRGSLRPAGTTEDTNAPVPRVRALNPPPPPIPSSRTTTTKLHPPTEC